MNKLFSIDTLSSYNCEKVFKLLIVGVTVLGVSFLMPQGAEAQSSSTSSPSGGNILNYPSGTRIYPNGVIDPPRRRAIYPATTVKNGDGSTTYYYRNGTRMTTDSNTVSPGGTFLKSGSPNGGLRPTPGRSNRGVNNNR
ncbi:hypothetical protein [Mastigocladopsis repens]|uniref:hypothetical protein n=1 Tax=Mastigocladopsis repens TaxID=221287 RepID=UPI000374336F|nr:hypothetical protein [Mastigocladopsis repens]